MLRAFRQSSLPFLLLAGTFVAGCGDDPADPDTVEIADFLGTWTWNVTNINSSCGSEAIWSAQVVISAVPGSDTKVSTSSRWHSDDPGPFVVEGNVSGNVLTIVDVTYPEDGGTLKATHRVTLQNNGSLLGTEEWSWSSGEGTCSNGSADVLAIKTP